MRGQITDLEKKVKEVQFKRTFGKNAMEVMKNLARTTKLDEFMELIANAHDADAKLLTIHYDAEKKYSRLDDDGYGMTPEEVENAFIKIGDSPKLQNNITPLGRRVIGRIGIGSILLTSLSKRYTVVTRKNGYETTITEIVNGPLSPDDILPGNIKEINPKRHGTTLELFDMNIDESVNFSLEELIDKIRWELEVPPDMKILVNGRDPGQKLIERARKFLVDKEGKYMGYVNGAIYYTTKPSKRAGIHVYVNRRRVGNPKSLVDLSKISMSLVNRVIGIIHANDLDFKHETLDGAILFDRSRFRDDDLGYMELRRLMIKALRQVQNYVEYKRHSHHSGDIASTLWYHIKKIKDRCVKSLDEIKNDTVIKIEPISSESLGYYDKNKNYIVINQNHPTLEVTATTRRMSYQEKLLHAIVDIISMHRAKKHHKSDSLQTFIEIRKQLWQKLNIADQRIEVRKQLFPMAMYNFSEIAAYSRISMTCLNYLVKGGLLIPDENNLIQGEKFLNIEKDLKDMILLPDLVKEMYYANYMVMLPTVINKLLAAGKVSEPFVLDFSLDGKDPCYFVEGICARDIQKILRSRGMDGRKRYTYYPGPFKLMAQREYSLPQLVSKLEQYNPNYGLKDVLKVIDYASQNNLIIRETDTEPVKFNYADFIRAFQHKRMNSD